MPAESSIPDVLLYAAAGVAVALVLVVLVALARNRRFLAQGDGEVFQASRLSSGNRLFPTQVAVTPRSVVRYKPRWLGHHEETIHIAQVASVTVNAHVLFSDVVIETTGGSEPIRCHGHRRGDATRMKALIEERQTGHHDAAAPTEAGADTRACPFCAETIKKAAIVCRFCNRDLKPA
jgi:hypothetical protein